MVQINAYYNTTNQNILLLSHACQRKNLELQCVGVRAGRGFNAKISIIKSFIVVNCKQQVPKIIKNHQLPNNLIRCRREMAYSDKVPG